MQTWDPEIYARDAKFVSELGEPIVEMLAPIRGERVLDVGCGDGALTERIVERGADVVGIDSSAAMVEAARNNGIDAREIDAEAMPFLEEFDCAISNAAIHWMSDHYAVVRSVWRALKPGGRFAGECGGEGCVRVVREGLKVACAKHGVDYKALSPWKFPEVGLFSKMLENQGFEVSYIARIDRPTHVEAGLRGWLEVFARSWASGMSSEEADAFFGDVEDHCRPRLWSPERGWTIDSVRLRFMAKKPKRSE